MNTTQQPETESTQPPNLSGGLIARLTGWSRRVLSPWVQHQLRGQRATESGTDAGAGGMSRATLSGRYIRRLLNRVRPRTSPGLRRGKSPAWAATRLAGAILHRHRTVRPGAAKHVPAGLGHTAPRRSELVLAGVSSPAQPRLYSAEQMAQMAAPGAFSADQFIPPLPPVDSAFSAGQRIPSVTPTASGFSVGQRIPPMPKTAHKKQMSARQKSRPDVKPKAVTPKPATKRIYSRVEEVLPEKPAMQPDAAPPEAAETEPAAGPQLQTDLPPGTAQTMSGPEAAGETSDGDAQKNAPPAGLQAEPSAETGHGAAPEPATRRDVPVQRRVSPAEADAPATLRPTGPQAVPQVEPGPRPAPETPSREQFTRQPDAARGPQPLVGSETAPDVPLPRRVSPAGPDAPQISQPAGPQAVPQTETGPRPTPETRPRQKSDEQPDAARGSQPFVEPETAPDVQVQRRVSPPAPDEPAALRPIGPQAVPKTEPGPRPTPEAPSREQTTQQPGADVTRPEKIIAGTPEKADSTAPAQIDAGTGQLATRGKRGPEQTAAAPVARQSPAEAAIIAQAEELPAAHPHSGPEGVTQPVTPKRQTGPEPKPSETASTNLERDIRRRAVARAQLPLHRPRSAPDPQPINRHGGAVPGGHRVQRSFRPAGSQAPGMPQPLPGAEPTGRPSLPEQLPQATKGRQPAAAAPEAPESSAPPAPPVQSAGPAGSEHPHLAALRAIEQHFGPAAMAPAQERLAGLAGLGQPKTSTPSPGGPDPVAPQPEEKPKPQPFNIDNISLGQPKVKVVRREPSQNGTAANAKTRPAPAGRISQGGSPLVLARKPVSGSKGKNVSVPPDTGGNGPHVPGPVEKTRLIQPNLSRLAQAVYPLVKRLIAIERERRPGY